MKTVALLVLLAVTLCHSLPTGSQTQKSVEGLLKATVQLHSWTDSFIQATDNGLDEDEWARLRSSASDANVKVNTAVGNVKAILGGVKDKDETTVISQTKAFDLLQNDAASEEVSAGDLIALLSTDALLADDARLHLLVDIFQKRMKALEGVIGRLRALLNKTDDEIADRIQDVMDDVTNEGVALFLVFSYAESVFQDAVIAIRPPVRSAQEEEEDGQAKTRVRRSSRVRRGSWSVGGRVRWTNRRGNLQVGAGGTWNSRGGWRVGATLRWRF